MPKNPKDVLSSESPNPKPKGPLGYSGNSLLGKAANWYANKQIFDQMKPKQVPQNEVPALRNNAIPGPPGSKNMAQLELVHMEYESPESGNRHQIEGYHLPAQPGKPTVVFFGGSDMDRTAPQYKKLIENMANDLKKQGVGLLVMDYPPNANEKKIQSFVGQVQNYLVSQLKVPMNKQAYSGYSLGGNPALLAANNNPDAAGLHLTATVSSIRQETKNKMKEAAPNASRMADKGEITTLMDNIAETRKLVDAQNQRQTPMPVSIVYSNQDQFGREGNNHMTPLIEEFEQYPGTVEVAVSEAPAPTPEQAHENVLNSFENLEGIKHFAEAATAFSQGPQVVQQMEEPNAQGNDINPPQAQNEPIQPDPELVANAPNYPAPPPPGQDAEGLDENPPQAQNQPIEPDPELVANAPNYPAPPPPGQDAEGLDENPPQAQNQPIEPDPELVANAPNYPAPPPPGQDAEGLDENPPQAQNQPIEPDPELVANAPNYPAPPPPGQDAEGLETNPPQAQNQPIEPDPELVANVPNYPAPPPPGQEMSKQPKAKINAKAKDAGDGMPATPPQLESANILVPDPVQQKAPKAQPPPPASRGTLSAEQVAKAINDHFPHAKVAAEVQAGHVPNYRNLAIDISHALVDTNMADRQAIEAHMIEEREIEPLLAQIDQVEKELDALEKMPGNERLDAKKAELNDLYEALDNWEVRVEALKRGMGMDDRRNRLAAINAEHVAEQQELEGVEKVDLVQFEPGLDEQAMQRRHPRLLAASGFAAESIAKNQSGPKANNSDFTPDSVSQQIQTSYKDTYGAKYRNPSPKNPKDPIPDEIKPVLAAMKPTIDKVNAIQQQIRDLDSARDQMILDHGAEFDKDPSLIKDAGLRKRVENDKQLIQQAEERIQHCDNQLLALQNPGPQAQEAARDHANVEQARDHYAEEKKKAVKQLNESKNDLGAALVNAGQNAVNQSPQANAILEQIAAHRQQQVNVLRQYKEASIAQAAAIMPELLPDQAFPKLPNDIASGHDVRSALKASAAVENNLGTHVKVAEQDLRRKNGQAPFQMYQNHVQMAAQEFKMRPQIIEDPAKREQGIALKQQMAEVEAKIAHYDNEMEKLEQGKVGARIRSLASGGIERRKEFYAQKKAAAMEQLNSLENQLDQVALDAVSESIKLGLLQDAKALAEANNEVNNNANIEAAQPGNNIVIEDKKKAQAVRKSSVAEALKRSHSMPNLSGHQPQVAANQPDGQQPKKDVSKDKSLRASGSWQAAKPVAAKGTGFKT